MLRNSEIPLIRAGLETNLIEQLNVLNNAMHPIKGDLSKRNPDTAKEQISSLLEMLRQLEDK